MVVYEHKDDYGFGGTYDSEEFGSSGPRIACCHIRPFKIDWIVAESAGRGLSDELEEGVEVFTPEQYRELFGYDPVKLPGEEDDLFLQN